MFPLSGHFISVEPTNSGTLEVYLDDGDLHREDGPALIRRDVQTGVVKEEGWYKHGELHRTDGGPAYVVRQPTGQVVMMHWCADGRFHRPLGQGSAYIEFDDDGRIETADYYLRGTQVALSFRPYRPHAPVPATNDNASSADPS